MRPDEGGEAEVVGTYRRILGPGTPLGLLDRHDFYSHPRGADVAFTVATGDERLYANLMLTVGFIVPAGRAVAPRT